MADILAPERPLRCGGPGLSYWLGTKLFNQPLAMRLDAARWMESQIRARAFDATVDIGASKFIGTRDQRSRYRVTDDGIALVPVQGMLIDRGEWLGDFNGLATSYEGLAEQFRRLANDEAIKAVVLDIDSPGGMVAGLFDLTAELGKLKRAKKVYAIAANMAYSAAYAIGCAAHELYLTRLGGVGSIGVIAIHLSFAGMLERQGVEPTILYAGSHKPDGNPYQALSHGARAQWSAEIDQAYDAFVRHVAKTRPLTEDEVRATEARTYSGAKAVEAKLADGVKSFEELLEHIRGSSKKTGARGQSSSKGGRVMPGTEAPAAQRTDIESMITAALAGYKAAQERSAPAATAQTQQTAPAQQTAVKPEASAQPAADDARARIKAILSSEAAKARPKLANYLALETDLDAKTAEAVLNAAAPETEASANPLENALARQMAKPGNAAGVKPEAGSGDGSPSARPSLADKVKARFAKRH
mgnify:CR=1 FL=1